MAGMFGSNALGTGSNSLRAIYNLLNNEDNNTLPGAGGGAIPSDTSKWPTDRRMSIWDVYKSAQAAVAYRVPDIGTARVQFIGNNREFLRWIEENNTFATGPQNLGKEKRLTSGTNNNRDADVIEAAVLYDGLKGLVVDAGVKVPLEYDTNTHTIIYEQKILDNGEIFPTVETNTNNNDDKVIIQLPYSVAIGVNWTPGFFDRLSVMVRADVSFGGSITAPHDEVLTGYNINAWLMPSYKFFDTVSAGIDLAIDVHGEDSYKHDGKTDKESGRDYNRTEASIYTDFGIGPWVQLNVGGGRIRTGLTIMLPGSPRYRYVGHTNGILYAPVFTGDPVISMPVSFTYSF
jgi:hypothetical protein